MKYLEIVIFRAYKNYSFSFFHDLTRQCIDNILRPSQSMYAILNNAQACLSIRLHNVSELMQKHLNAIKYENNSFSSKNLKR